MTVITTINDYLYIGGLFLAGTFGAFAFTSYCIVNKDFKRLKRKVTEDDKTREETELKQRAEDDANSYENKYSLRNVIHNKNHCDLSETYIFEATPSGVIILNYDIETKSFNYWCDHTINYKYLQVAARKFVSDNQCKDYYIQCDEKDIKSRCVTDNNKYKNEPYEEDHSCVCDSDNCKLPTPVSDQIDRDYNEAEQDLKKFSMSVSNENDNNKDDIFVKSKRNSQKTKMLVANKYSHKGNLIDFYGPSSKRKTGKDISFADFVKQNKEQ